MMHHMMGHALIHIPLLYSKTWCAFLLICYFLHRADRETFIKAKYVDHAFVHPHPDFTRREVVRPLPRRPVSPRFPSQFARPISTASAEGMVVGEDAKSQSLTETSSLSSVDPTLLLMAQNLMRVQGFGGEKSPRLRSSTNLFSKFGGKIISKAKGWKASLEKGSPIVGRKEMGGGREDAVGEMTVVEEGEQVATNHLPLRKDLDDLERKGVPFERSSSHPGEKVPLTVQTSESAHGLPPMDANLPCPLPADVNPSPRSSPPPPKPPRTHRIRRSVSGRARIDVPQVSKPVVPPASVAIEEGKVAAGEEAEGGIAPNVTPVPTRDVPGGTNENIPPCSRDASLPLPVDRAPVGPDATPTKGDVLRVLAEGVVPEEGFEEAREMKVAFRDPNTLKRSLSLSDHRFSVLSEEWFSPNEDEEDEDDDDDDEGSLKLLTEEDHFSTPPTSPEDSPIKVQVGGGGGGDDNDDGIVIVAHQGTETARRVLSPVSGVAMDAALEDHVSSPTINVFLLPKRYCAMEQSAVSLQPKEGSVQTPLKERRLPKEGCIQTPPIERTPFKDGSVQTPRIPKEKTPPKDGSTQTPSKEGSTQTPPKEGSTQTPPKEGSTQTPPKEGSTQTHPKGKEVHGCVSDSPMPPYQSVVQVVPIPPSPRECATGPNFPFVQSPGVKRASFHQFPVTQQPPRMPRTSVQTPPHVYALPREAVERSPSAFRNLSTPTFNPLITTTRTSPSSVERSVQRPNSTPTVELLGSVPAASSSLTKLSDSEDVFEDRSAFPPSGGNHPSGGNRPSEDTASLVSSFSVQDLQDIFKGHIPVPTLRIHSVDDSMIPNGPPDGSKKSPSKSGIHSRLSQSTLDMTSLDGESGVLESNSLERSPSVGTQPPEVEVVVVPDSVHPDVVSVFSGRVEV